MGLKLMSYLVTKKGKQNKIREVIWVFFVAI